MRSSLPVVLLSLLSAASPSPFPAAEPAPQTIRSTGLAGRTVGGILLCIDVDWSNCGYKVQPLNECIVLTSPYLDSVSGFGPDEGTTCELYSTTDCTTYGCSSPGCGFAPQIELSYPGSGDLRDQDFNDHMGSFSCWAS